MDSKVANTGEASMCRKITVFSSYVALFVNQAIIVKLSLVNGKYVYNTTTVVLLTELTKFIVATTLAIYTQSLSEFISILKSNLKLCILYFIPAILYSFHNNLSFVSLEHTDPATYYVLLQLRTIVTGVVFQLLFKKRLAFLQWVSLMLLFFGCLLKEMDNVRGVSGTAEPNTTSKPGGVTGYINFYVLVILFQVMCSCLAGVYTEYLLKKEGEGVSVHTQNVFMYVDSMFCNLIILVFMGKWDALTPAELSKVFHLNILAIVLNGAIAGLMTAFLLKCLNSIMKVFANSFEIVFVAIASWLFLGVPISYGCIVAMLLVCVSLTLYWYGGQQAALKPQSSPSKA